MTGGPSLPEIIGHRGYSAKAPENTLAAIEMAIEAGADAVEFDLHVAACGTPVLFHDTNLGRTTNGVGPVRRRTLGQLQALDAGSWFDDAFQGERIPSLEEALEAVGDRVGRVYCEVKGYRELEDLDRMVTITDRVGMTDTAVYISLDWGVVDRIGGRDPALQLGLIVDEAGRFETALSRARDDDRTFLDVGVRVLREHPEMVDRARSAGVEVGAWTVNDPEVAESLFRRGVTRITTDEVSSLLAWRESRG